MPVFLVLGLYNGLAVNYIVFFMQLLLILAVLALHIWTVYSFRFSQKLQRELGSGGEETLLRIKILNPRPLPIALMEIDVSTADPCGKTGLTFSLPPFGEKRFDIPITMPYCGMYDIGMAKSYLTDIFGLTHLPFDMRKLFYYRQTRLMVYPAVEALGGISASLLDEKLFSSSYLRLAEEGDSVSGLREYRQGDSAKRIHWKRSVGQGTVYIKQYDQPLRQKVFIIADLNTHHLSGEDIYRYSDTLCRTAAALCRHSLTRKREVSLFSLGTSDKVINRITGDSVLEPFLKWLALLHFGKNSEDRLNSALEYALKVSDEATAIFVLTREPDGKLINSLEQASVGVGSVSLVRIEEAKTYDGRLHTLFVEPGGSVAKSLEVDL
jgi:uncharacterized protein (DUF58 family)